MKLFFKLYIIQPIFILISTYTFLIECNLNYEFSNNEFYSNTTLNDDNLLNIEKSVKELYNDFKIIEYKIGDFKQKGENVIFLVIERDCDDEDKYVGKNSNCRTALFIEKSNEEYFIITKNPFIVDCSDCGGAGVGDPYRGINISENVITFESLYGSCDKTYQTISFKYEEHLKDWYLVKIKKESYGCHPHDKVDGEVKVKIEILTQEDFGKVRFSDFKN